MIRILPFSLLCLLVASNATAYEGTLDARFSGNGKLAVPFGISDDRAIKVLVDSKGRYTIVGNVWPEQIGLARFLPDGTPDTSIWSSGHTTYAGGDERIGAIFDATIDVFDRIVVVGYGLPTEPSNNWDPLVCRFTANGTPDTSVDTDGCRRYPIDFVAGGIDDLSAVTTDSLGNIYAAGTAAISTNDTDFLVMKFASADASPVVGFGYPAGTKAIGFDIDASKAGGDIDFASAIVLQGNSLYVGGAADDEAGLNAALVKLDASNGALDPTFCPPGKCTYSERHSGQLTLGYNLGGANIDQITALAALPNGNIALGMEIQESVNFTDYHGYLVTQIRPDGESADGSYGFGDVQHIYKDVHLTGLVARSDGKIIVAGDTGDSEQTLSQRELWIQQLLLDGSPDADFAPGLGPTTSTGIYVFPHSNLETLTNHLGGALTLDHGRILMAGARLWNRNPDHTTDFDFAVLRLQGDSIFTDGHEF